MNLNIENKIMKQYIDKNRIEEILRNLWKKDDGHNAEHRICYNKALQEVQCELDTLEVKEVDTWHLQENENIYDAVKDWNLHTFACVMKDGTIQKFIGNMDEDYEGHINIYICGANDDYDNVDDIVKWIEFT